MIAGFLPINNLFLHNVGKYETIPQKHALRLQKIKLES